MWDLLRGVRDRVENHLGGVEPDLREAAVMAASELVENAVKYAGPVPECPQATLDVAWSGERLVLKLKSGVRNVESARQTVDRVAAIARATDKRALYFARIRVMLTAAAQDNSSQLGLLRICGEGEFDLAARLDTNVLHLTATRETKP